MTTLDDYAPLTYFYGDKISPECVVDCGFWGHKQKFAEIVKAKPYPFEKLIPLPLKEPAEKTFERFSRWSNANIEQEKTESEQKLMRDFYPSDWLYDLSTEMKEELKQIDDFNDLFRDKAIQNLAIKSVKEGFLKCYEPIYDSYLKDVKDADEADAYNDKELERDFSGLCFS